MFQERYNRIVLPFFFILDFLIAAVFYAFTHLDIDHFINNSSHLLFPAISWALISFYFKSFRVPRAHSYHAALRPTFNTWIVFSIIYIFFNAINLLAYQSFITESIFIGSLAIIEHLVSIGRYKFFLLYRRKGKNTRNTILLGSLSTEQRDRLHSDGIDFGYFFLDTLSNPESYLKDLVAITDRQKLDLVLLRESDKKLTDAVSDFCDDHGIRLKLLLSLSIGTGRRVGLDIIGGFPVMDVRHEPLLYLGNRFMKRALDIFMSSLSIIFVLTWLPLLVKLAQIISYPGSLFFIQDRIGRDGKLFRLYKFRTMRITYETNVAQKGRSEKTQEADVRVSWFGSFLRRTNLDEYPQFLNVFAGSMSTVGPRPHMVGEDLALEKIVSRYRIRRFVKPGITGWAAINGYRGGTNNIELMTKRTEYDIWYLENWSLWLDIKIMIITIWQMITLRIPKAY